MPEYVTLSPVHEIVSERPPRRPARRLATLDGAVVGLLANGKANSEELLDAVYAELSGRFELKGAIRLRKDSVSIPPRKEQMEQLLREATVVVTAIGD